MNGKHSNITSFQKNFLAVARTIFHQIIRLHQQDLW